MRKIYHKFLIVFVITIIFGGLYVYSSNSLKSEAALSSSLGNSLPQSSSSDDKIASDISFISTLVNLNRITIDTTLFENKAFQLLKDNTVKLEPVPSGRENPFAPLESGSFASSPYSSPLKTNEPIDVTDKTAVLSGSVNNVDGVNSGYFEYGLTEELGQKTNTSNTSLIGTFISNITNLNPTTTYFYRACARIGGSNLCGNIVSFETN